VFPEPIVRRDHALIYIRLSDELPTLERLNLEVPQELVDDLKGKAGPDPGTDQTRSDVAHAPSTPTQGGADRDPQATGEGGTGGASQPRPSKKRHPIGYSALKIIAVLESFADKGEWNARPAKIKRTAEVTKSTYYHLLRTNKKVMDAMRDYKRRSLGRGPVRADDE
jgi:hypothetical protein